MTKPQSLFFGKVIFFDGREYDPCTPEPDLDMCGGNTSMNTTEKEFSPEHVDWHPDNTPEENSVVLPDGSRIEVVNPMEIKVVPAENEDEGSSP